MAVVANVQLQVDAKSAIQQLDRVKSATQATNKTFQDSRGRLRDASGAFTLMSKTAGTARKSITALGATFTTYLAPVVALSAAIGALGKSLTIMSEREADAKALANGLKGLTTDGEAALNSLRQSADRLGKATLFNEEDFTQGFKLLTSFRTIGVSSYERVASTAADMAQVLDQDVNSVLLQVAKALEAPEVGLTALQRSGTRFTEQQKQQVKAMVAAGETAKAQTFILKELERQYGGAGAAAAKSFAGAMDTLGEVTRDALADLGGFISPVLEKGIKGLTLLIERISKSWKAFGATVLPQVEKAAKPVLDVLKKFWDEVPWNDILNIVQNYMLISFKNLATVLQIIAPIIAKIIDGLVTGLKNSPLGFIVTKAYELAKAMGLAQPIIDTVADDTSRLKTSFQDTIPAVDAVAAAQQRQTEAARQALEYANQQKAALEGQKVALEDSYNVNVARLNAEKEVNNLQKTILEREYSRAKSASERLAIAQRIFDTTVQGARIEYEQALAGIEVEAERLKLRLQGAEAELATIRARGTLAILEEKSVQKQQEMSRQLQAAVASQQQAIGIIGNQISAQARVAEYQKQAAKAQLEAKIVAAQMQLEQRAVSDEIGQSTTQAQGMADRLGNGVRAANDLATGTQRVATNANQASYSYIAVANQANNAATAINNAAAAQERLNRARSGGGSGGSSSSPEGAANGAYWQGGFRAFAKGGMVTGPTLGLIGEGGENEYIIPQSKAAGFAMNYLSGKRGAGAIPGFADGGFVASTPSVSIQTGPVTQMDGTNYVTTDDMTAAVSAGIRQTLDIISRDGNVRAGLGF